MFTALQLLTMLTALHKGLRRVASVAVRGAASGGKQGRCRMGTLTKVLLLLIALVVGAAALYLALWDIPAPTQPVEKEIPAERLGR